ncbi:10658_t:CDS:2, partial [Racocetra persica]
MAPINASHHEFPDAVQKAFLPAQEILAVFEILKVSMPSEASNITQWLEEYYILGKVRHRLRDGTIATYGLPLFLPSLWSIYDSIGLDVLGTQNVVEAWHYHWKTLVEGLNVSAYKIINEIQKEQQNVETQ